MKLYKTVIIRREGCPEHLYKTILEMAPNSMLPYGDIEVAAKPEENEIAELVKRIVDYCQANNLPWSSALGGGRPGTYAYEIFRKYELHDFTAVRLLNLSRGNLIQLKSERDEQGRLLMDASKARAGRKIGRIEPNWIVIPESVRKILAAGNFKGLEFGEVALKGTSARASTEPFWELKSSLTLPKMANTDRFVSVNSVPFDGDYTKMVWIKDPPYRTGEIHYRESDLKALGEFDVARTLEKYKEPHPALVVSQRFYQHCLKNKIPLAVEPVRIDD